MLDNIRFRICLTAGIMGEAVSFLSMIALGRSKNARCKQRAMAAAPGGGLTAVINKSGPLATHAAKR